MVLKLIAFVVYFTLTVESAQFHIKNLDGGDIWIGIQGGANKAPLEGGGFVLKSQEQRIINSLDNWEGRFWSRTWCDPKTQHCISGDCGNKLKCNGAGGVPPASLAEIKLKGDRGFDYYDISLVDGFNTKVSFGPINGRKDPNNPLSCKRAVCNQDINAGCPAELQVRTVHGVTGCKSACLAFNNDQYCCRGAFNDPNKCLASRFSKVFKSHCPDAYSWAYDDRSSLLTCSASAYAITFGG